MHIFAPRSIILLCALVAACGNPSTAPTPQDAPAVAREMRGIWVATVRNIDWPSRNTLTADQQRLELIDILDRAVLAGFNTIVLQVRPAADAVYRSDLEPWSLLLTGRQGTDPGYDPLAFAVEQAHARGLELHAWINPFRAGNAADSTVFAPTHVFNARRDLVRVYGAQLWLDPGDSAALEHSLRVVRDIVQRYDIDGIHADDYFYPYPVNDAAGKPVPFPDSATYARSGTSMARDDWRRDNIDRFVERMYRESHAIKPSIKVGLSPFGIWRPGNPAGVAGFDAYAGLYADARKWLRSGWVDYLTPQLYWAISAPQQSFPALLDWWIGENAMGRHIWPGLATYRAAAATNGFTRGEIAEQVKLIRTRPGMPGHIMFNTTTTLKNDNGVLATLTPLYKERALSPSYPWLDSSAPAAPSISVNGRTLKITHGGEVPRFWLVRTQGPGGLFRQGEWETRVISGQATYIALAEEAERIQVSAVDAAGNLSAAAEVLRQ